MTSISLEVMAILPASIAAVTLRRRIGFGRRGLVAIGDADGLARRMRAAGRDGASSTPRISALRDEVGAHLARADDADADRAALVGARREIAGKAGQGDIGHGDRGNVGLHGRLL